MKKRTLFFLIEACLALVITSGCTVRPAPSATPEVPTATWAQLMITDSSPTTIPPSPSPEPQGKTLLVTSPEDSGPDTLRQVLIDAQPFDVITFDPSVFPPAKPVAIVLSSSLSPIIQGYLTIDASNAGVILDGSNIITPEFVHGLVIESDRNTIQGLQIVGFSDAGIALSPGAQYNLIGGDRNIGNGLLGQGNLISGNGQFGIGLWGVDASHNTIQGNYVGITIDGAATWGHARDGIHSNGAAQNLYKDNVIGGNETGLYLSWVPDGSNTVTGNLIGVGPEGNPLGNNNGIIIDNTSYNTIGPGNWIAHNRGDGISFWEGAFENIVTQNSVHDNGGLGIWITRPDQITISPPIILNFDLGVGKVSGTVCVNCIVEIFSDSADEGKVFEGFAVADANGSFTFEKGVALAGPFLTATATDTEGSTSEFSLPTQGSSQNLSLQVDNARPMFQLQTRPSNELADNRIGDTFPLDGRPSPPCPPANEDWAYTHVVELGFKWVRLSLDTMELAPVRNTGNFSRFEINPCMDEVITLLSENGITILYTIVYWDETLHTENYPNYKNEEEIKLFLDYTRLIVRHFKGRIQYYEILNEPVHYAKAAEYVNLIRHAIPVIREEDPEAEIVVGGSTDLMHDYSREYLFAVLQSDIMPLVDGIATHPMYGVSPQYDETRQYYDEYPSLIQQIKDVSSAHGFRGEYFAEEMVWRTSANPSPYEPWQYTDIVAAKYFVRGVLINRGLDLWVGVGLGPTIQPIWKAIQNLSTTMASANNIRLPVEIEGDAENIASYSFGLSNGDRLFTVWNDNAAVDYDPGVSATLTFSGIVAQKVIGIDVLHGFEQELIFEMEDGNLVIRNFLMKDYPIILRLTSGVTVIPTKETDMDPVRVAYVKDSNLYVWDSQTFQTETVFTSGDVTCAGYLVHPLFESAHHRFGLFKKQESGYHSSSFIR